MKIKIYNELNKIKINNKYLREILNGIQKIKCKNEKSKILIMRSEEQNQKKY